MTRPVISIVNYGVANVGSMLNMMRKLSIEAQTIATPEEIRRAEKIILPGVGAFDHGMKTLVDMGLAEPLRERVVKDRIPLLGVCLGMQMLGRGSEEGTAAGLGVVQGYSKRFVPNGSAAIRIPHMGWSELAIRTRGGLMQDLEAARFYFVHSYHFVCDDPSDELASARYGIDFTAAVHRSNVWGVQFHPEKSHRFGMTLLRNFAALE
jgi:imidazole glycerol-phosphate synthase subunit HisH